MYFTPPLHDLVFDENAYQKYLDTWLDGIKSELHYWKGYIETKGFGDKNWNETLSNERQFCLEKYLTLENTKFLDVGSGPFSSCGLKTSKTKLEFSAVDPLAYIYKNLKQRNSITTGIIPEYSMVERLTERFEKNTFDIVHMSNSLDHSFNPLIGIFQMLLICKIGGKIILRHMRNVAEYEDYRGMHQWNLSIENSEFIIWRPGVKYNATQILKDYTDISVEDVPTEQLFTVILIKKTNVPELGIQNTIVKILNEKIFEKMSELIISDSYKEDKIIVLKSVIGKIPFIGYLSKKIYKRYKSRICL